MQLEPVGNKLHTSFVAFHRDRPARSAESHHSTHHKPMNILITGASGHIAAMLRQVFAIDEVTLLSRRPIALGNNEKWFISGNLQDSGWWQSLPADRTFDVIFHLAEPVKERVADEVRQVVIENHVRFVSHFTNEGAKLIYPLTAYLYDNQLSRSNAIYAEIKRGVYDRLKDNARVSFPIIHPICDAGQGLGRLIQAEKRIPFINILCAFEATIPVLRLAHLRQRFADPNSMASGCIDVFSETLAIRQLFKDDTRINVVALSRVLRHVLALLSFVPSVKLLVHGRHLDDSML